MSQPITLDENDHWDGIPDAQSSVLDRAVAFPRLTWSAAAAAVALLLATLLRFVGLDRWPLSVDESEIALTAHGLVHGDSIPNHFFGAPFAIEWIALFFFAGGALDSVARIAMASAGLLAIVGLLWVLPWLGARAAASAAILGALSPTLVVSSRLIDGGALLVALTIAVIGAALRARRAEGFGWPIVAGAATGLLVLTAPLGFPAALLAWFAVFVLMRPGGAVQRDSLLAGIAAFATVIIAFSTALLTRPQALPASVAELFERLWQQHITDVGAMWYMPVFNLLLNEPLLLALGLVAIVASPRRDLTRSIASWFVAALVLMSLLGGVGTQGYALIALPLVLLAAVGAECLIDRLPRSAFRSGAAPIYVVTILLLAAAVISLLGLVSGGVDDIDMTWLLRFVLVVLVAIVPLVLILSMLGPRVLGARLPLIMLAALILLSGLSVRSAVLAASERMDEPGDPLAREAVGSGILPIVARVERLSRDMTANQRTAIDPTGGHGLRIALDEEVAQPFQWYFREFPNVTVFDASTETAPADAEIVLVSQNVDARTVAPGREGQNYLYNWQTPGAYDDPSWTDLLLSIVRPNDWREFADFLIDREFREQPEENVFQLLAVPTLADRLFPDTGPFTLDDRAGAGAGQGQFNQPRGIAVAHDGTTYVVDSRNGRIQVFDPSGAFVREFGNVGTEPGQLGRVESAGGSGASGIAIGPDGNVYVADTWNHRIQAFSPEGTLLHSWGQFFDATDDPALATTQPGMFYGPRSLVFHDDLLYVTDTGNERVQVFEPDGTFVRMFGSPGSGSGELREPVGIAVTEDDVVLIADSHNARIARFTVDGEPLEPWPIEAWNEQQLFEPFLAIGPNGTIYASNSVDGQVQIIGPDGNVRDALWSTEIKRPYGIAVWPDGTRALVSDGLLNSVVSVPLP